MEEVLKYKAIVSSPSARMRVPVNRVGEKVEDDKGNTTLPVMINKVESIAILDSGGRYSYEKNMGILGRTSH